MTQIPFLPTDHDHARVLIDDVGSDWVTYGELAAEARDWQIKLDQPKSLVFLYLENTVPCVAALLGAMAAGHAVAVLDAALPDPSKADLEAAYHPDCILTAQNGGCVVQKQDGPSTDIHPDLSILLSTSGSTGGPKFVRLTQDNMVSNAMAIAQVLDIQKDDVAAGHLQLHYSYGLSVLSSHLVQGARCVLTQRGFMEREFWPLMKKHQVTHFPGVPFHYDMMRRLRFERLGLKHVRTMTQAGGHLTLEARQQVHDFMSSLGGRFYVLYGQTEAAPRITTLDHADFVAYSGSVGPALPGGRLRICDEDGTDLPTGEEGIVWYTGPNVMMGYAENRADLARGDEAHGQLATGDIGRLDDAGRLTITGRAKRFGKIYGLRINLDEVETLAKQMWSDTAIVQKGDVVHIYLAGAPEGQADAIIDLFKQRFTLPQSAYKSHMIAEIPHTSRGKINYRMLESL